MTRRRDGNPFSLALTLLTLTKVSDSTEPTDYAAVSSDLGVASLLQGVASTLFG